MSIRHLTEGPLSQARPPSLPDAALTVGPTSNTTSSNTTISGTGGLINSNAPNITNRAPIDPDTPTSAYSKTGIDNAELELVFSDEFNIDGESNSKFMDTPNSDVRIQGARSM